MAANGAALEGVVRDFVRHSAWPDRQAVLDRMAESAAFPRRSWTASCPPPPPPTGRRPVPRSG
ncbi:hypothetical protein NKH77_08570 [Streptomyces sp. M19]